MQTPYTISIPEPVRSGELEPLAQILVAGNKLVEVHWMRSARQAICGYNGQWFAQSDQNILNGVARIIKYEKDIDTLAMENLFIFESPGRGHAADDDMTADFRDCEWSDYGSDRIAFQCTIREKNEVRAEGALVNNMAQDPSNTPDNMSVKSNDRAPPVLSRATECCCCCMGCSKDVEKTAAVKVDKNRA